jgi:hypothetical protein
MGKTDCAVTVFGTKDEYRLDHKNTKNWRVIQCLLSMSFNTAFPCVMSSLPAEIEYTLSELMC